MIQPPRWPAGPLPLSIPGYSPAVPIGSVCLFAGDIDGLSTEPNNAWVCAEGAPPGSGGSSGGSFRLLSEATAWLPCDGRNVRRHAYPALFRVLGTRYGASDDTHFALPDLRGAFVRGVDNGAGVDPDTGERYAPDGSGDAYAGVGSLQCDAFQTHEHHYQTVTGASPGDKGSAFAVTNTETLTKDPTGRVSANETRARNIALNFLIRAR